MMHYGTHVGSMCLVMFSALLGPSSGNNRTTYLQDDISYFNLCYSAQVKMFLMSFILLPNKGLSK